MHNPMGNAAQDDVGHTRVAVANHDEIGAVDFGDVEELAGCGAGSRTDLPLGLDPRLPQLLDRAIHQLLSLLLGFKVQTRRQGAGPARRRDHSGPSLHVTDMGDQHLHMKRLTEFLCGLHDLVCSPRITVDGGYNSLEHQLLSLVVQALCTHARERRLDTPISHQALVLICKV